MRRMIQLAFAITFLCLVLPATAQNKIKRVVELKNADGKSVGTVELWSQGDGVGLELHLHDLTPGDHAIHFHQNAVCEGPDFKSAGGHFNPEGKKHGFDNPDGHHAGDLRNFTVDAEGKANGVKLESHDATLNSGPHSLLANGAAVVVHAKADDYKTDPSGNSGDRIACGVISK
jgi:superoxide dismutase, Cu-Zn family